MSLDGGTPRCKQNILPSFLYNNLIIWNHKIKPLDPWVFCIQDNSRSCQSNVPRPTISGISILGLCYETSRHQNLSFTQQKDLNMFLYISISQIMFNTFLSLSLVLFVSICYTTHPNYLLLEILFHSHYCITKVKRKKHHWILSPRQG